MSDWTHGYIDDLDFTTNYYREQSLAHLEYCLLLAGITPPSAVRQDIRYCELGFGRGVSLALHAATMPSIRHFGLDFSAGNVLFAESLAGAMATNNLTFREKSFEELLDLDTGFFDVVVLRGILSWVNQENREYIVEFIRERLNPGGIVYLSYNSLPGRNQITPLRSLMMDAAAQKRGPTGGRIQDALAFVDRLMAVGCVHFDGDPRIAESLKNIAATPTKYIAHEYFNQTWDSFYYSEMVDLLGAAKLQFGASGQPSHLFDEINLSDEQASFLSEIEDPSFRGTVRDFILNTEVRRDIFVKGQRPLTATERRDWLLATRFSLTTPIELVSWEQVFPLGELVETPIGWMTLDEDAYRPILEALADGPKAMAALIRDGLAEDAGVEDAGVQALDRRLAALVSIGAIAPLPQPNVTSLDEAQALTANKALRSAARRDASIDVLISPIAATGIYVPNDHILFLDAEIAQADNPVRFVADCQAGRRGQVPRHDPRARALEGDNSARLSQAYDAYCRIYRPFFKGLGLMGASPAWSPTL